MKIFLLFVFFAGVTVIPSLAFAQKETVDEAQIFKAAMLYSPAFQAAFFNGEMERAHAEQEGRLENPTLDLSVVRKNNRGNNSHNYDVEIEQPLKISQISGARRALSNELFERASLREQHSMIQSYWEYKLLYAQAWEMQELVKLYQDFQDRARETSSQINQSVRAGQTPISEGSLFEGDVAKFGGDLEKAQAEFLRLRLMLEKATGIDLEGKDFAKPSLQEISEDLSSFEEEAYRNASLVRLLEADLRKAEKKGRAERMDAAGADIAPRIIYGRSPNDDEDVLGLGVVLTIPLWDQNQSERRIADAQKLYARRQLDTLQQVPLSQRLERILSMINRVDRRIESLEKEALIHYRKGFSQAQKSFRAGQINATALWQVREILFETEREALGVIIEAIEARRLLSLEVGLMPMNIANNEVAP
jgi:outer membrane protein TolC